MHDSWKDATGVRAPALVEEYYQRKSAAVWTIQIDQGVRSSTTSTFLSALSTPIVSIFSISFMNNGAQQRSLINPRTGNLFSPGTTFANAWWSNPDPWPTTDNSPNDDGRGQTSYFPNFIPNILDEIYPTSITLITMRPYKPDRASTASSHIIQAAGAGPSIEIENPAISVNTRQSRFARKAERLPNGRFKSANRCTPG